MDITTELAWITQLSLNWNRILNNKGRHIHSHYFNRTLWWK